MTYDGDVARQREDGQAEGLPAGRSAAGAPPGRRARQDRVVKMVKSGVTLTFDYDYLGRRVRKVASGGAEPGTFEYVYDGRQLLAVYKNDALKSSFTWGLDKSGTPGGAGGTGGLLLERTWGSNLFPIVDAQGNVTGMLSERDAHARLSI